MNSLLDWFTNYCINNQLISKDNEVWFRYVKIYIKNLKRTIYVYNSGRVKVR